MRLFRLAYLVAVGRLAGWAAAPLAWLSRKLWRSHGN